MILTEGIVCREYSSEVGSLHPLSRDPGDDLLEVRTVRGEKMIFLKPLDEELEFLSPDLIVGIDEKPIIPDQPLEVVMSSLGVKHSVGVLGHQAGW